MPCACQLFDGVHWYVDKDNAPYMYMVASSPEQAEHNLRSWAGKVVRLGNIHMDLRPVAARVLRARVLNMVACCEAGYFSPSNIDT